MESTVQEAGDKLRVAKQTEAEVRKEVVESDEREQKVKKESVLR